MSNQHIKVLLAKKKIDVHGRASKLIARELRDAGMEVVYFRFGTVDDIVTAAIQEDVNVIALSIMTSGHMLIAKKLIPALKANGMTDVLVIIGGIIPEVDFEELEKIGIHKCFISGLPGETVAEYIKENVGKVSLR
ncbi:(R)-methylmalonyl-CoA mutase, adenosylcobamide-binding subunit [Geobacter metallireducens GS-15]|uniref:(R)-methylmalonyl-CoA mutase, adenosylcobamide-binding subunit n=1 Tax=Geobacter metallireducens (strain ATCC 53774 / DSM 7210 / GS-15) TaxID=269799 RepID=Q39TI9_GEOMG|nr:cobalamin-dependent protein [Geobacter metallireducens]ABB32435.1 (R)-methylmalonyl-CoA mutase, adenosylcobamide-binding subunit [Geobacter metallireducens GS-15]